MCIRDRTGDGYAMAFRAGARLRDMEFMQFHPTALHGRENPTLLLTEALRGEGAYLVDQAGVRFMEDRHPLAELASRDIVVRGATEIMERDGTDHVWLDATHLPCDFLQDRFPVVYGGLRERGYDPVSYTHLRAHETVLDLVCRLLLEKKKQTEH